MIDARRFAPLAATAAVLGLLAVGGAPASACAGLPCLQPVENCQFPDQMGHGSGGTMAATSDPNAGFFAAENFSPLADATITEICWWGIYFDFDAQMDCGPGGGDSFQVTYYENGTNVPGAVLAGPFDVFPISQPTGSEVNGIDEYEYSATHAPVPVLAGNCYWVEVRNAPGTADCSWLWTTAPPGDGRAAQDTEGDGYDTDDATDYDLSLCLDIELDTTNCLPPPNDDCADAIGVGDGAFMFSNVNASTDGDPETLCNVNGDNSVRSDIWYRYSADCDTDVTIDLCASTFNTRVAVYEGFCPNGANQALACDDDGCGTQSILTFSANAGTFYFIRIGGFEGEQGDGVADISSNCIPAPSNDECGSAQPMFPGSTPFDTTGATTSGPTQDCPGDVENDIWFRLVDGCDEQVGITATAASGVAGVFDPVIAVYGPACPSGPGDLLACGSSVSFDGSLSSTFRVRVGSSNGTTGSGTLEVTCGGVDPCAGVDCNDDNDCTEDFCEDGECFNLPLPTGTACGDGGECDGAGDCILPDCPGDTNGDNDVDVNDLNNVILDWGTDGSINGGDITGPIPGSPPDGIVNGHDLNAVIVNWGECV